MKLQINTPHKALNKAYLKEKVGRVDIETLKAGVNIFLDRIDEEESEEHLKNVVSDFLKNTWYGEKYEINTKGRNDLVIHTGKSNKEPVGVIIEVKKPLNKVEMISLEKPNSKAMHELILYYLRERIEHNNIDLKYLIATNIYEWYIIDEIWFEQNIYRNMRLKKDYENWKASGNDTKFFYDNIAKPHLELIDDTIPCTYLDIRSFTKTNLKNNKTEDSKLILFYKILSPSHLLKQPFANDSNSLDTKFYSELLHLIGLEEIKEGSKTLIKRKANPDPASFLENTILKLKDNESLSLIKNVSSFGTTKEEQQFAIALELSITWVNRLLFLKLLEGQLLSYQKGNRDYLFLNFHTVFDFGELSNLFFQVLAVRSVDRHSHLQKKYSKVPYLNSSLFEKTDLEKSTFDIGALDNRLELPLADGSVLKKSNIRSKTKKLPSLEYLFEFLDSYDFSSVGSEEIQEENKNLINASVLGLIFEKINGYKDGSFFTPGFVTMQMCRESIRKAVVQKFNDTNSWNCKDIGEVFDSIENKREANEIINNLKICDPAVGSGHFLVSALNEILAIKSELKILLDSKGNTLRDYHLSVVNDELIIMDDDGKLFEYNPNSIESRKVQEALFHEKEVIIENCLFGVDLNNNSVKICRLRLWIELLKNAYYTQESNYEELETLPNIDINIKCGDSLVNRFDLDDDLTKALKKIDYSITEYKQDVRDYKSTNDSVKKKKLLSIIDKVKSAFTETLTDEFKGKIAKARGKVTLTESKINAQKEWGDKIPKELLSKLQREIKAFEKIKVKQEEIVKNIFFRNAFEWRFEFPEVLDPEGDFQGFDLVIGNPPYLPLEQFDSTHRDFFREKYIQFERKFETSVLFIVEALRLLQPKGFISYIAPVTWQTGENYSTFRKFIFTNHGVKKIVNLPFNIFPDAYVETAIYLFSKESSNNYEIYSYDKKSIVTSLENIPFETIGTSLVLAPKYKVILNPYVSELLRQLKTFKLLGEITISTQGLAGSSFPLRENSDSTSDFPFLAKGNVYNFRLDVKETYNTSLDSKPSLKQFYESGPKILIRRIINRQDRLTVGYTEKRMVFKKDINPFIPIDKNFNPKYLLAIMASRMVSYIYLNISSIASKDDFRQTTLAELREIPIPVATAGIQKEFVKIVDIIMLLNEEGKDFSFFERIIDAMVYEMYMPQLIAENKLNVIQYLEDLPSIVNASDPWALINRAHKELSSPNHPLSSALLKLLSIPEVSIIEGRE